MEKKVQIQLLSIIHLFNTLFCKKTKGVTFACHEDTWCIAVSGGSRPSDKGGGGGVSKFFGPQLGIKLSGEGGGGGGGAGRGGGGGGGGGGGEVSKFVGPQFGIKLSWEIWRGGGGGASGSATGCFR